ncbi:HAMP domain-containing sensor histidine kinase [Paenibacillus macerans]|uniref:HAMP domain-containing sensor histidine kinase n=1 Tax=Paenibacillus macerans TaxID=44252 RepID=UPI002041C6C6|nr:HAMP domain-containing sensor histidine kinase [Paenibacillus macerans]MCM3702297.1 HAMP domain-containing histidine kinase [Paenibacillus macerans]
MKRYNQDSIFKLVQFRWVFVADAIVVVGAVMAYGLIARYWLGMNRENALSMLAIIPLMLIAVSLGTLFTLRSVRRKMGDLLIGIKEVSNGNLEVRLDSRKAEEYAPIYDGFNRMTAELKNTKAEMQNFVNEFSHEFKTPITSISGFAQYLIDTGDGIESPERIQYLRVIADESLRLSTLSQNTLLLSKVEACEIITEKEAYDLSEQIKRCAILLLPKIEQKKIELELDVDDISYVGNAELMEQVWINLLSNAIKFTPEHGEIKISAKCTSDQLTLKFSDSGVGMDKETTAHIFEKYYQHDTTSAVRGNGIGLSIVSRIISLCGGEICVESKPQEGSTFIITLPV